MAIARMASEQAGTTSSHRIDLKGAARKLNARAATVTAPAIGATKSGPTATKLTQGIVEEVAVRRTV